MLTEEAKKARREYAKRWREKNREKINNYMKDWKSNNKEKVQAYNKKYWEKVAAGEN